MSETREDGPSSRTELMSVWRKAAPRKRRSMMRSIVGTHRHEFIGQFLIIDADVMKSTGSVIMHLPSGMWRTNSMPIKEAIRLARGMTTEQAQDTIQWLHEL